MVRLPLKLRLKQLPRRGYPPRLMLKNRTKEAELRLGLLPIVGKNASLAFSKSIMNTLRKSRKENAKKYAPQIKAYIVHRLRQTGMSKRHPSSADKKIIQFLSFLAIKNWKNYMKLPVKNNAANNKKLPVKNNAANNNNNNWVNADNNTTARPNNTTARPSNTTSRPSEPSHDNINAWALHRLGNIPASYKGIPSLSFFYLAKQLAERRFHNVNLRTPEQIIYNNQRERERLQEAEERRRMNQYRRQHFSQEI